MKIRIQTAFIALFLPSTLIFQPTTVSGQGTAFTYQGRLSSGANAASGNYDLTFSLFNVGSGGSAVAGPLTNSATAVSNGLFLVTLDFGGVFSGANCWLEIGVRTNGNGTFTTLAPRQPLTPTPYAIHAEGVAASGISGTIPAANVAGTYGNAVTFNNGADSFDGTFYGQFFGSTFTGGIFTGAFVGSGSGLGDVWHTGGNSGTTAGVNFVGTTDNQPLELHVNGVRALRLEPTGTNGAVNVIGGSPNNHVTPGVVGATISGGGAGNYAGGAYTNNVTFDFGTVGGGFANLANGFAAVVAGGYQNANNGFAGFIGAGDGNIIVGNGGGDGAFLGGGYSNTNGGEAATLVGGTANFIGTFANNASIGGGGANSIVGSYVLPVFDTIAGGYFNVIQTNISYAAIGGGVSNTIQSGAHSAIIGGGSANQIQGNSVYSAIGGGIGNTVQTNALNAVVAGGSNNVIRSGSAYASIGGGYGNINASYASAIGGGYNNFNGGFASVIGGGEGHYMVGDGAVLGGGYFNTNTGSAATVGGGQYNAIIGAADHATIAGGNANTITGSDALPVACTIGGGQNNSIQTNTSFATIGGGNGNVIQSGAHNAAAAGGSGNLILGGGIFSTIGGGANNTNFGPFATIAGGVNNLAGANAFAAGSGAQAGNQGSFVWADATGAGLSSTNNNSVTFRATGGYRLYSNAGATLGVFLAANGNSWSSISDRNAKKNIQPVNYEAILDKLAQVPVRQWNYKSESDGDTPNLGPMAQDFKAAFYPGRDDKTISTLEFDGVELAAIMGLNRKLDEKDTEIHALKQRNEMLEKRLDNLEQMVELITDKN